MSVHLRRTLPLIITFVLGVITITDFYLIVPGLRSVSTDLQNWAIIMLSLSYCMGGATLTLNHARNAIKQGKNWIFSIQLVIALWVLIIVGVALGVKSAEYKWIWDYMFTPISQVFKGMPAMWMIGATYRAFRLRSMEAAVLLGSGIILLLGNAAVGSVIWSGFSPLSSWIMGVLSAAAFRAIVIGAAMGIIITGMRILVGYERGYLGMPAAEE